MIVFLLLVTAVTAAPSFAASNTNVAERPNAGGAAEEITVLLGLLDIDAINDKDQRFNVDAYIEIQWIDHRLAGAGRRVLQPGEIWTPQLTIVNDRGLVSMLPSVAEVNDDGQVTLRQRLAGPLAVDLELRRFPFDAQMLTLDIVSYRYPPAELVYGDDSIMVSKVETFSADGWQFTALEPGRSVFRLDESRSGTSMLSFVVRAERNAVYFVLTLALPMLLILSLAWMVHWLPPDIVPARIGMSTATVFSLIALGVSARLSLPRVAYLTYADRFIVSSTLTVLLSLSIAVVATRWLSLEREDDALRLTRYAQLGFPIAFGLIIALTFIA